MSCKSLIPIRTPTLQPLSQDSGGGTSFFFRVGTSKSSAGDSNIQPRGENAAFFFFSSFGQKVQRWLYFPYGEWYMQVVLKLQQASESPGGRVKTQIARAHSLNFWLRWPRVGPLPTSSQVLQMQLGWAHTGWTTALCNEAFLSSSLYLSSPQEEMSTSFWGERSKPETEPPPFF